jgi:hypothetical protein
MTRCLVVLVASLAVVAGCGGNGDLGATHPATSSTSPLGGVDLLLREANRTERLLDERVRKLVDVGSVAELTTQLSAAQSEIEEEASRVENLDLSPTLDDARGALASALRLLATKLGEVTGSIEDLDLQGALESLRSLDLSDVERAIREIRAQTPGG